MSVEAFSGLPLQVGHAVAATAGRTAMWAIAWYMQAPLRNTALAAMMSLSAMAGSNALYNQSGHHPAPLFGSFDAKPVKAQKAVTPVMPAERPAKLLLETPAATETTGSIESPATTPSEPIRNEDVFEVQRKLTAFKLFDGKVDGLYGPRTARAVKAFEEKIGRAPSGKLTLEVVDLIKATPITAEPAALAIAPIIETKPVSAVVAAETVAPLVVEEKPLPAPTPLLIEQASEQSATTEPVALPAEDSTGTTSLEMTSPPALAAPTKRTVQTIAVRAPVNDKPQQTEVLTTPIDVTRVATDPRVVGAIQRGLSSLGFLHGEIDGVAGEATAKAIRNFEVYYNYNVTGLITPELVNLLVQNGAVI